MNTEKTHSRLRPIAPLPPQINGSVQQSHALLELQSAAGNIPVITAIIQKRVYFGVNVFMHTEKAYIYGTTSKLSTLSTCLCTIYAAKHVDFFVEISVYIIFRA